LRTQDYKPVRGSFFVFHANKRRRKLGNAKGEYQNEPQHMPDHHTAMTLREEICL